MKISKLNRPKVSQDTILYGVFSPFSVFKQAWHLNHCPMLNFELFPEPYQLFIKNVDFFSLHHIHFSTVFDHFSVWFIENQGSTAFLSGLKPKPNSFLIIKGDIAPEELESIENYLKDSNVFSLHQKYDFTLYEQTNWLLDIENYKILSKAELLEKQKFQNLYKLH